MSKQTNEQIEAEVKAEILAILADAVITEVTMSIGYKTTAEMAREVLVSYEPE